MHSIPSARALVASALLAAVVAAAYPGSAHAIGVLIPTQPDLEPLMIRSHRVTVTVRERAAETKVEQVFRNSTGQRLEATYIFPIPAGAAVSGFAMWVNGQRLQGELLDAGQARSIYEQIVARMRDPGLVESMGGNLFRARVFPIEPNSDQRIEISFTQVLPYDGGVVHYRYPLRTGGRAARTMEDMTISAEIVSRTAIRAVYSPTHSISVARPDDHHATVGFEANAATLDTDFDLYYAVQDSDVGLSLLTHRQPGEDGYFLAMIAPRSQVTEQEIAAKEVLFVFDTSGSMAGDKIERARAALDYMLQRLRPTDRFQVVRFSTDVELLFDGGASAEATPENIARARRFARGFAAAGGTAVQPALVEALRAPAASGLPRMVVFLTDGMPTVGETEPARIVEEVTRRSGDARLFAFGVGDDVNTTFLDALASANRGVGDYFRDGAEMERRLSSFYDRVAYPLLTDLALALPGVSSFDTYPRDLGHLYRGAQLLVVGRYRTAGASHVTLTGKLSSEAAPRTFAFDVNFPATEPQNDFLPRLWATRKIGYLLDEIRLRGERTELREEVVTLSRRFGIVTPYTSYLVAPDSEMQGVNVPVLTTPTGGGMRFSMEERNRGAAQPSPAPAPATASESASRDFEAFDSARVTAPARPSSAGGGASAGASAPQMQQSAPSGGMGDGGRRLSARLRTMREADRTEADDALTARFVAGRTFTRSGAGWTDSRFRTGMRTLRLRAMSAAYFALLRARPDLASALALGDTVTVTLDNDRAIIVDPTAPADLGADQVTNFLR
jgi:Ca-activated chloride channel family protein